MIGAAGVLPLFFVLFMAQFSTRAVQPVVTLFVQEMVGMRPDLATLGGHRLLGHRAGRHVAVPLLGKRSDEIGYRRVLLICLAGATLTSLPQAFADSYWVFAVERFGVGLFIGGILPTANALVGRMVSRGERGTVYGMTASATFLGNSLGPLTGGAIAAVVRPALGVPDHRGAAAGEPGLGLFHGPGIPGRAGRVARSHGYAVVRARRSARWRSL